MRDRCCPQKRWGVLKKMVFRPQFPGMCHGGAGRVAFPLSDPQIIIIYAVKRKERKGSPKLYGIGRFFLHFFFIMYKIEYLIFVRGPTGGLLGKKKNKIYRSKKKKSGKHMGGHHNTESCNRRFFLSGGGIIT